MHPFGHRYRIQITFAALMVVVAFALGAYLYTYAWQEPQATVRINVTRQGASLPDGFFLYQHLTAEGITIKSITSSNNELIISFNSFEESQAAEKVLKTILDNTYRVE